jgi:predicted ATPase
VTLEPLTILVGRNASGKSNFLDALAFLSDVMALGVTEAAKRRGGWSAITCRTSASRRIELEIEASFTRGPFLWARANGASDGHAPDLNGQALSAKYHLELAADAPSAPRIDRETLELTDDSNRPIGGFEMQGGIVQRWMRGVDSSSAGLPHSADMLSQLRPDYPLLGVLSTRPIGDLWAGLRHMAFYNFLPAAMRPLQRPMPGQLLDQQGSNLASVLADIDRTEPWAFERIGQYLSAVVPQIERLAPVQYGEYETIRFWLSSPKSDNPLEFNADGMSDGTLRVLAALTAVFQNVPPYGYPSVVGIEEPESALHPEAMRALAAALDEAALRMQVLLTTHSPDLLDVEEVKPENVRVVQMIDGRTIIGPVDEANVEIVGRQLNTLGGLERDDRLEPDLDDRDRQQLLQQASEGSSA